MRPDPHFPPSERRSVRRKFPLDMAKGLCYTSSQARRCDRSPAAPRPRGFSSPEPEISMPWNPAIEDCFLDGVSDTGATSAPRRTGWRPLAASRTSPPAGRRFQGANPSRFSPVFAPVLTGFRPAFPLLFRRNSLKYNDITIFFAAGTAFHTPTPPPGPAAGIARRAGPARISKRIFCNRRLHNIASKKRRRSAAAQAVDGGRRAG